MPTAAPSLGGRIVPAEGAVPLPPPPGAIRQFLARHPWFTDWWVVGIYLVPTLLSVVTSVGWYGLELGSLLDGVAVLGTAAALLFRRYRPVTVFVITCIATIAMAPDDGALESAMPFAVYALAVYRSSRAAWIGLGIGLLVGVTAASIGILGPATGSFTEWPGTTIWHAVTLLIATLIGLNVGNGKRYVAALVDRANQLERERDQQAQLAAASERSRIAREMHDIVAHGITVMVRLAEGSAASAVSEPERASAAMEQVADTGRQALRDMRRMLGVLRGDDQHHDPQLQPQPGSAELDELIASARTAGLPVTMTVSGGPPTDPAEQLIVYRIVQESLTNVLRHATTARSVAVSVEHGAQATVVRVVDDGADRVEPHEPGHGLLGMRERAALYGGSVEAGPGTDGGWTVTATVPRGVTA